MIVLEKTIPGGLKKRAEISGDKIAYIYNDMEYTWSECDRITDMLAMTLRKRGIKKGTHVGIWGVNSIEWIFHYFAVLKTGAIAVLLNYSYKEKEIKKIVRSSDVEFLFVGETKGISDCKEAMENIKSGSPELKAVYSMEEMLKISQEESDENTGCHSENKAGSEDTAVIIFTSGTTKEPKGVMLGHGQIMAAMASVGKQMEWKEEDRQLLVLPLFHGSGINCGITAGLEAGLTTVLLKYYQSVPSMEAIQKYKCNIFNTVPSMLLVMMRNTHFNEYDLSSLESGILSGSTVGAENYKKIIERFHFKKLRCAYGMTETSTLNTLVTDDATLEEKIHSAGRPFPGMELRIWCCSKGITAPKGEVGEIQIKGDCVMQGYYKLPEVTKEQMLPGGWFRTGDAGYMDEKGNLYFKSRLSQMIVRGGENISPLEIEECIEESNENIASVKVVGTPDPVVQEQVVALVQTEERFFDEEAIISYVKDHLADFKVPSYVFRVDNFEMTKTGKVNVKAARELARKLVLEREEKNE